MQSIIPAFKRSLKKNRSAYQKFLRRFDRFFIPRVSRYVNQANDQAWAETDCLSCANCCKVMTPTFTKQDIARISAHLNMSPQAFKDKWLMKDPDSGDWVNHTQPCQFLDQKTNMCNIYEIRPHDCAAFPHFKRKPFADFNHIHEQNIDYCPATFRFVTHMKAMIEKDYEWS